MPMNLSQVRVVDPILSNVAQGYRNADLVGFKLFPGIPVQTSGGQVIEFGRESFKLYSARRAPGSNTRRIDFGYLGNPFALVQDSLEGKVPTEWSRNASQVPGIDLGQRAVTTTMRSLTLSLENEQAQLATNAANYDNNHKVALTGTNKWSDYGHSNPTGDIETGREAIRASVGIYPNTLLLSALAFKAVKNHPGIIDRFKYTSRDSVTSEMLAQMWSLDQVVIGGAVVFDDANASADVWGNNAVLAYVPRQSSGMEDPSFGYTYTMQGHPLAEQPYYDNNAKSWIYPVTYERAPVLSGILSGYLIQDPA
ncbi:MAG: major capsid protein [Magnetococcales bacterium]|nr:major capsid protein [Magnetococcales bacterium]